MKKMIAGLCLAGVLLLAGCAGGKGTQYRYGFEEMTGAFWNSDIMYNESVLLLSDDDGAATGNLLFEPLEIISVRDCSLETEYVSGKDYALSGRTLTKAASSGIPSLKASVLMGIDMPEDRGLSTQPGKIAGEKVLYTEGPFLFEHQVFVTYRYDRKDYHGPRQQYVGERLTQTMAKLGRKEPVKLMIFGDSISTGCNNSAGWQLAPFTPTWMEMVQQGLKNGYGSEVELLNQSKGGMDSLWGKNQALTQVAPEKPDLTVIGFGMNDGTFLRSAAEFKENIRAIMQRIRMENENAEFVLLGTMMANPKASQCGNQEDYFAVLQELAAEETGTAAVDIGEIHREMLKVKNFSDCIANNINHPNDFLIRVYAMQLLAALVAA